MNAFFKLMMAKILERGIDDQSTLPLSTLLNTLDEEGDFWSNDQATLSIGSLWSQKDTIVDTRFGKQHVICLWEN